MAKHVRAAAVRPRAELAPTPLEMHVAFFDRNNDGVITPLETYRGCRAIGCNVAVSAAAALMIHGAMGWPTSPQKLPTLNITVSNIHGAMHGSDTRLYNERGQFDAEHFDSVFDRYDTDGDGHWNLRECFDRVLGQRSVFDIFGITATVLEFGVLYYLVGQNDGISREDLRGVYDGSLFSRLEDRRKSQLRAEIKATA